MAQARSARAINQREKTRIRNLQYGPRTRLVTGVYSTSKSSCVILFPECLIVPFYIFLHLIVAFKMYHVLDCKDSRLLSLAFFFCQ